VAIEEINDVNADVDRLRRKAARYPPVHTPLDLLVQWGIKGHLMGWYLLEN